MSDTKCDKLILAILQGDDYYHAIEELNEQGFYVTVLNSSGGFLKRKSVTVMIGVSSQRLEDVLQILKRYGERTETHYHAAHNGVGVPPVTDASVPVPVRCGGVTLFVLDVERHEKY